MTPTPGWYPDQRPSATGQPMLRWWDGSRWTDHVAPAQPTGTQPTGMYTQAGIYPQAGTYGATYGAPVPATTPDGQPLAGWWQRVGASIIDGLIATTVSALVGLPFLLSVVDEFQHEFSHAVDQIEAGGEATAFGPEFMADVAPQFLGFALVALLVGMVYEIGFLRWKQATPGKMALGIAVRLREQPGQLPWGTLFTRWLVKNLGNIVGNVPFIGGVLSLAWLLNFLWPLWDDKKQALHDKAGRTNVVRVR